MIETMTDTRYIEKDPKTGRFLPGNSGFGGKPVGARSKLGEAFISDLYHDWLEHGAQVLRTVRTEDPVAYAKIVALLVSKCEMDFTVNLHSSNLEQLIEERRQQAIVAIDKMMGPDVRG